MTNSTITKQCNTCSITKPISDFYKNRTRKDGYAYRCKECQRLHRQGDGRESFLRNRKSEKYLSYMKQYEKHHRKRSKNKLIAKWKVEYAVKTGVLPSPKECKCWECGEQAHLYHHILGYAQEN